MNAIDTNVLIYAHDSRAPRKQAIALALIQTLPDAVLMWQVACEYLAASRKLKLYGDDQNGAWQDILDLAKVWPLRLPATSVLSEARTLTVAHSISIWDALLIAACSNAGVTRLYTEDMQHGATFLGVEIHNPFPQQ